MTHYRGQTTLDFAVGMSVFLLAVIFVIAYAPTMFDPFTGGTGTKLIVADRAATTVSADLLATSSAEPGVLSMGCTAAFFDVSLTDEAQGAECARPIDGENFEALLSLGGRNANVTIHDLGAPSSDPASPTWVGSGGGLTRTNSASVPSDVAVATRTVSIEGTQYRLTVRVW
jgi:hypothetical protein